MKETPARYDSTPAEPPMLGDHLAMDLLNTEARNPSGDIVDFWRSGQDVLAWLARVGMAVGPVNQSLDRQALLTQAVALRALAHRLIARRKLGEDLDDVSGLNAYLHAYSTTPHLDIGSGHQPMLKRRPCGDAMAAVLGPVAQGVAELLVDGNFDLVKQCEHPDCILWFYDRTKAHKRRWCSMASCGNRHKAAQFRKRSSGVTA